MFGVAFLIGFSSNSIGDVAVISPGSSNDVRIVQSDCARLANAVYSGDVETVLAFTHPTVIERMGGASQATNVLKSTFQQFKSKGMKLDSQMFPTEPIFLKSDRHNFAIVPTKSIVVAQGQRLESLNYQFGIRDSGHTNWTYIEGSRINSTNVVQLFPDFPKNFAFPTFYRKKL